MGAGINISAADFNTILPEIALAAGGIILLLMQLYARGRSTLMQATTAAVMLLALVITLTQVGGDGFGGMVRSDLLGRFASAVILAGGVLTVLLGGRYLDERDWHRGEYYSLLLFACVGMLFLAKGIDLLVIFLGLELLSISLYVLVGFFRERILSNEAALKYLLLGAFSSGFLLYGIALIYGAYGTTNLAEAAGEVRTSAVFVWLGTGLLLVGIGFKVAVVPFHMWQPDVYQGAPTPVTAFMSTTVKAAAFAALLRIIFMKMPAGLPDWQPLLWLIAALSMTVGNFIALQQSNLKRLLAFSSIAHAGYLMVGITAGGVNGAGGVIFYLFGYLFINVGAFGVVLLVEKLDEKRLDISDYAGLARTQPYLAGAMALFMFSLAGIPLTAGFTGKFYLFSAAVEQGYIWLVVLAVLNSLVSVYYYLRVVVHMFMKEGEEAERPPVVPAVAYAAVTICSLGVLYIGIAPGQLISLAKEAVSFLF